MTKTTHGLLLGLFGGRVAPSFSDRLLEKFSGGSEVAAVITQASDPYYTFRLMQHIGNGKYWMMHWEITATVGANVQFISYEYIVDGYRALNSTTTPAVTFSGTWSTVGSNWQQSLRNNAGTAGNYAEVTTSDSVSSVGCTVPTGLSNGMMHVVAIDGDNTLADLLPTAQSLVDAGTLDSSALIANGGTLNPTDRIFDTYNKSLPAVPFNIAYYSIFTRSLSPGVHTVRFTITPYKNVASAGGWWVIGLPLEFGTSIPLISAGTARPFPVVNTPITSFARLNEISYNMKPTGASSFEWLGHSGSLKWAAPPTISINGGTITPVSGVTHAGNEIVVSMSLNVRHSYTGATNIGTLELTYTINQLTGLTIAHVLTWAAEGTMSSYPLMMTAEHATMDRFATEDFPNGADLTANDDSFNFNSDKQTAYCWDSNGQAAQVCYIPDLGETVNNWTETDSNKIAWADVAASGGIWKKAYITRIKPARAFENGEVLRAAANYRVGWFPDGANAALAP